MLAEPDRRTGKSFLLPPSNQGLSPMCRSLPQLPQKVIKILQGVGPTDTAYDPIVQPAAPVLNSQKTAAETAKCTPASHPRALNIWTERRADNHCITQVHLQFGSSEHIKLKLEPVADRSIRIEMDTNLNATIERFQRRRADLKRYFLNQGYHTRLRSRSHILQRQKHCSVNRVIAFRPLWPKISAQSRKPWPQQLR